MTDRPNHDIGDLTRSLEDIVQESKELHDVAKVADQARRRLLLLTFVVAAINGLLLLAVLAVTVRTTSLASTIVCHTKPGEECYERALERQADVVELLIDAQIAAVECATAPDVRGCVEQKLAP